MLPHVWILILGSLFVNMFAFGQPATQAVEPAAIQWERDTLTLIAPGGFYGRVIQLQDGSFLAGFSLGNRVVASTSPDARTWSDPVHVAGFDRGHATNSEVLQLQDGRILYFFNERAESEAGQPLDNGIGFAISDDGGTTWSEPRRLYGGGPMWEPVGIQRPDGEVLLFFADEKPFPHSHEQQISLLRSTDRGDTWSAEPEAVSYRAGFRDGMFVPIQTPDGALLGVIEDNGFHGAFKPVILDLTDRAAWPITGASERRWGAVEPTLSEHVYAGAPYLARMAGGATVLSAQVDEGTGHPRMQVWVSDVQARHFGGPSEPFSMTDPDVGQLWNALYIRDGNTIGAVAGTVIDGQSGLWLIEGRLTNSRRNVRKAGPE